MPEEQLTCVDCLRDASLPVILLLELFAAGGGPESVSTRRWRKQFQLTGFEFFSKRHSNLGEEDRLVGLVARWLSAEWIVDEGDERPPLAFMRPPVAEPSSCVTSPAHGRTYWQLVL